MAYRAKVIEIMIASPSDVVAERQVIRNVIQEWNYAHSEDKGLVLMPVGWESHSAPAMGERPQAIINKEVLANCDLLIAVFWTRLGTPTGKAGSGTVEEIEEHLKARKPAMIYFSNVPVVPESVDEKQFHAVQKFKAQLRDRGLYAEYRSPEDFRDLFSRQLAQTVNRHFAAKKNGNGELAEPLIHRPRVPSLSGPASFMLIEASQDSSGTVYRLPAAHGRTIQTSGQEFAANHEPQGARWESALAELCEKGLLEDRGQKGEVFTVTGEGYRVAELLREKMLVPL